MGPFPRLTSALACVRTPHFVSLFVSIDDLLAEQYYIHLMSPVRSCADIILSVEACYRPMTRVSFCHMGYARYPLSILLAA